MISVKSSEHCIDSSPHVHHKLAHNNELPLGGPCPIRMIRVALKSHNDLVYKRGEGGVYLLHQSSLQLLLIYDIYLTF